MSNPLPKPENPRGQQLLTEDDVEDLIAENSELSQFAHILSHDLRAPIRNMNNLAMMIAQDEENILSQTSKKCLENLQFQAKNLSRLISDLREISKQNLGNLAMDSVSTGDVLLHVLENYDTEMRQRAVKLTHDKMPYIYANPQLVWQLFDNLIRNALKHGSQPLLIHIQGRKTKTGSYFLFENSYENASNLDERIFEFSPKSDGFIKSTGLGLHICKKIVTLHRGRIFYQAEADKFQIHVYLEESGYDGN